MSMSYSVLCVDDSSFIRNMVRRYLSGTMFRVVAEAKDGVSAVEVAREENPDVILLDIVMPEKNGYFALMDMIKAGVDSSIFMLSSVGTENMVEKCLTQGARSFIQKPFSKELLLNNLEQVFHTQAELSHEQ